MINKVYPIQGDNAEQARAETPVAPLLPQNLALPASGKSDCDSRTYQYFTLSGSNYLIFIILL